MMTDCCTPVIHLAGTRRRSREPLCIENLLPIVRRNIAAQNDVLCRLFVVDTALFYQMYALFPGLLCRFADALWGSVVGVVKGSILIG